MKKIEIEEWITVPPVKNYYRRILEESTLSPLLNEIIPLLGEQLSGKLILEIKEKFEFYIQFSFRKVNKKMIPDIIVKIKEK